MIIKELHQLIDKWVEKIKSISVKKGQDYASQEDTLLNFKKMCTLCQILDIDVRRSPSDVARFYIISKQLRLGNLVNKPPTNESVEDSELDNLTYCFLNLGVKEDSK